ncbi:hypothetical protein C9I56_01775 [Paraburkholderia caribensis]|uniref:Uncharacterized protein n=1 Tax=Paraburkholderia caribensis TaxID=75105 RepID=A0A9Q6S0C3_9BURK|nr:hypothetical protein C9I56_01775 [Paraburkholderia caribensis]QLB62256.1 hypothetical protein A9O66_07605 [Paraburkholderia caribensis]
MGIVERAHVTEFRREGLANADLDRVKRFVIDRRFWERIFQLRAVIVAVTPVRLRPPGSNSDAI